MKGGPTDPPNFSDWLTLPKDTIRFNEGGAY